MISSTLEITHAAGVYPLLIGVNCLQGTTCFSQFVTGTQVAIITNTTVAPLYAAQVQSVFSDQRCDLLALPDGEQYKTAAYFLKIIDFLSERGHHRDTTLIALGGAVIGDMTGFAAACYHRGVAFIQVPTTLLAQIDSSIGGKTAVNHAMGKNLLGAFYQPSAVIIDLNTLNTLPTREYQSGLAEMIKAALIQDATFFDWLEMNADALLARDPAVLEKAIYHACDIKRRIVMRDERERGERAFLNFGHTFGHAIEHHLGYGTWLHGEAVALGMRMAADLSFARGYLSTKDVTRINTVLDRMGYCNRLPVGVLPEDLVAAMQHDKKVYRDRLNLILLQAIGSAVIQEGVLPQELLEVMQAYVST